MKDENGQWQYWDNDLQKLISRYFNDIFTSKDCNGEAILTKVKRKVNVAQNQFLTSPFEEHEIKEAIFAMHPNK